MEITKKVQRPRGSKYGFHNMISGHTYHYPTSAGFDLKRLSSAAHSSNYGDFTFRTVFEDDPEGPGIRIWKK